MAYSNVKLKSSGDMSCPFLGHFWIGKISENV
jgi:hypothetical protein